MWSKIDDKLHENAKARRAGPRAMGVWVMALSWSGDVGSDGFIPGRVLTRWGTVKDANRLVAAGLWTPVDNGVRNGVTDHGESGYLMNDWAEYNPTHDKVEADRKATRERVARWRAGNKAAGRDSDHGEGDAASNAVTNAASDTVSDTAPTRPDPISGLGHQSSTGRARGSPPTDDDSNTTRTIDKDDEDAIWQRGAGQVPEDRIADYLGCSRDHARKVRGQILDKAPSPPTDPVAYVLGAIRREPDRYREHQAPQVHRGSRRATSMCEHGVPDDAPPHLACEFCSGKLDAMTGEAPF